MPLVSIVVVTYGTGTIVVEALDAVRRHTEVAHEVIVVDNPPDDGRQRSAEILRGRSDIVLIEADRNLGFGGGNNLGVETATGEYICFLNPDAVVGPGWIEPLLAAMSDPAVAIAAPVLLNPDGTVQEAGQVVHDDGESAPIGEGYLFSGDTSQLFDRDVDYASAACWVVRRAEHLERGGFDPRYERAYFEDADYAFRVERDGQRTRLVSSSRVVHHHGLGGAGRDVTLAQISQTVFLSIWGDRLTHQLARSTGPHDAVDLRDRLATRRTVYAAPRSRATIERRRAAFAEALGHAANHPRERVTFVTDGVGDVDNARTGLAGLELVATDDSAGVDRVVRQRRSRTDRLVRVRSASRLHTAPGLRWIAGFAIVALVGAYLRSIVLRSPFGGVNADEAYTGIQAFEILNGAIPITLGGTVYTWPFESFLYAPLVAMFDAGVLPLKLLATASWVVASLVVYLAGTELRGRRAGVIAAALMWVTPGALLIISVTAYVSYSSGMLVSSTAFLVACRIVDVPVPRHRQTLTLGVLAGLAFWMHPMFLAAIVPILLVVLVMHRRRPSVTVGVSVGGVIGCSPFLAWNAVNGWPSLETPVDVEGTYLDRLTTFVRDLLPRAFGLRNASLEWHSQWVGPLLYGLLLALVVAGTVIVVRRSERPSRLLLPVVLVLVLPTMAMFSPLIFAADGRYGIISFPFIVLAVAVAIDAAIGNGERGRTRAAVVVIVASSCWLGGLLLPTVRPLAEQTTSNPNAQAEAVVQRLDEAGISFVYGNYWSVLPVEFAGSRQLTGGVFPFWPIRFPERQRIVEAQPPETVAIVFGLADDDPFRLFLPLDQYVREEFGNTVVYIPISHPQDAAAG